MSNLRLTRRGRTVAKYGFQLSGGVLLVYVFSHFSRVHNSSYYRYWLFHKKPWMLKAYYFSTEVFGLGGAREQDYQRWGVNTYTEKPYLPQPDRKTRKHLAEEFLDSKEPLQAG